MSDATTTKTPAEPTFKNIREKLLYIQQNIRVNKNRGKGHDAKAGVTYEFRNAEDIFENVKPPNAATNTVTRVNVVPQVIGPDVALDVRCVKKDDYGNETFVVLSGPRFAAVATAYLMDCDSDDVIESASFAFIDAWRKGQTEPEKLCGSADSYASKYALAHLYALDNCRIPDADDESNARQPEPKNNQPTPKTAEKKPDGFDF